MISQENRVRKIAKIKSSCAKLLLTDVKDIVPFLKAKNEPEKPAFYKPLKLKIENVPTIVYPCGGIEEQFDRTQNGVIEKYLIELFRKNEIKKADFNIVILWNTTNTIMSDVWTYELDWGSGALTDTKIFRNFDLTTEMGTGAEDGLILLRREAELRKKRKNITNYFNGARPKLPDKLNPTQEFYQTEKKEKSKAFLADTISTTLFSSVAGAVLDVVSGSTLFGLLIARLSAVATNLTTGGIYGWWEEKVYKKLNIQKNSSKLKKGFADLIAFNSFQVPVYGAIKTFSNIVSKGELCLNESLKGMILLGVLSPLIGPALGLAMKEFRKLFKIKTAEEGGEYN
ncbi:L-alanine exporter AlaE [Candidatus Micrarchaeota archaeon]|nr:L-alanine exporter AlaE [Candidatus Micrarchaeota archaeon]